MIFEIAGGIILAVLFFTLAPLMVAAAVALIPIVFGGLLILLFFLASKDKALAPLLGVLINIGLVGVTLFYVGGYLLNFRWRKGLKNFHGYFRELQLDLNLEKLAGLVRTAWLRPLPKRDAPLIRKLESDDHVVIYVLGKYLYIFMSGSQNTKDAYFRMKTPIEKSESSTSEFSLESSSTIKVLDRLSGAVSKALKSLS